MKDATDLAFAATSARPASREKRPSPPQATANGGLRPTSAAGWSKPAAMARPTSAGARKETFGASSSLAERQALGGITQIGELEGEAQWQSDVSRCTEGAFRHLNRSRHWHAFVSSIQQQPISCTLPQAYQSNGLKGKASLHLWPIRMRMCSNESDRQ